MLTFKIYSTLKCYFYSPSRQCLLMLISALPFIKACSNHQNLSSNFAFTISVASYFQNVMSCAHSLLPNTSRCLGRVRNDCIRNGYRQAGRSLCHSLLSTQVHRGLLPGVGPRRARWASRRLHSLLHLQRCRTASQND